MPERWQFSLAMLSVLAVIVALALLALRLAGVA